MSDTTVGNEDNNSSLPIDTDDQNQELPINGSSQETEAQEHAAPRADYAGEGDIDHHDIDSLLDMSRRAIEEEVGALLGLEVKCEGIENKIVTKQDFFLNEVSGKQVIANLDLIGDIDANGWFFMRLKDTIRVSGSLLMIPKSELEQAVNDGDFSLDYQDAYDEIVNIILGGYTSVFEEQYPKKIRFVNRELTSVIPMKVDIASDRPMPDHTYYISGMKLTLGDVELGKTHMVLPAADFGFEPLSSQADISTASQQDDSANSMHENQSENMTHEGATGSSSDVLIISDLDKETRCIAEVLKENGLSFTQLSYKENVKSFLPGHFRAVFLVMEQVDEQSFAMVIKIASACSLPLIATGSDWTRSKVIKAAKYGVSDILLMPAESSDINEKVQRNIVRLAA